MYSSSICTFHISAHAYIKVSPRRRKTALVPQTDFPRLWHGKKKPWRYALKFFKTIQPRTFLFLAVLTTADFYSHISRSHFYRTVQTTENNGWANIFRLCSTAWGTIFPLVSDKLIHQRKDSSLIAVPFFCIFQLNMPYPSFRNERAFVIPFHRNEIAVVNSAFPKLHGRSFFSFVSPIPFLHEVFPYGINRYRAGAKVWRWALEIKGQASGFRENLHAVG